MKGDRIHSQASVIVVALPMITVCLAVHQMAADAALFIYEPGLLDVY